MISDSVEIKDEWGTPSKFRLSQTPPYPHPHLLAMGLLLAFAYYFAQTMSLKIPPCFLKCIVRGVYKILGKDVNVLILVAIYRVLNNQWVNLCEG